MLLKLHASYFVNEADDFHGFLEYHGGGQDPFVQWFIELITSFNGKDKTRRPFSLCTPGSVNKALLAISMYGVSGIGPTWGGSCSMFSSPIVREKIRSHHRSSKFSGT